MEYLTGVSLKHFNNLLVHSLAACTLGEIQYRSKNICTKMQIRFPDISNALCKLYLEQNSSVSWI